MDEKLLKILEEMAEGAEQAAEVEAKIFFAYAPEMGRWEANTDIDAKLTRQVRVALDAQHNCKRFTREAEALRTALVQLRATPQDQP